MFLIMFCRIAIGLVFLISVAGKLKNLQSFYQTVQSFNIAPRRLTRLSTAIFLVGEVLVIFLMLIDELLLHGFLLAGFLLVIFSIALTIALKRKINTSCNCFGSSKRPISQYDILRNAGLVSCACIGIASISLNSVPQNNFNLIEWGLAGLMASAFVVFWLNVHSIFELLSYSE